MSSHIVFHTMGIPVHVTIADDISLKQRDDLKKTLFAIFDSWDRQCSRFREDSELHHMNMQAGNPVHVSARMFLVIARCLELAQETDGAFDPSAGAYLAAAGYGLPKNYTLPHQVPTYHDIRLDGRAVTITCAPGQVLEPAGIVKGMAIDAAAQALQGIAGWMINAGGDILTHGPFGHEHVWRVGIQHPRVRNAIVTIVGIRDEALATSGTYEVVFEKEKLLRHHQVDMHSGASASDMVSLSVIAPTAQQADEYASIGMLLGKERGVAYLDAHGVPYLLLGNDGGMIKNEAFTKRELPVEPQ